MANEKPKLESERKQTDESLRTEREHTDALLARKLTAIDEKVDRAVDQTRAKLDELSEEARLETDRAVEKVPPAIAATEVQQIVAEERARQDAALEAERRISDEALRMDREAHVKVLASLRPLARQSTDRSLLIERDRSDAAVDNRDHFLGIVSHDLRNLLGGIVFAANSIEMAGAANAANAAPERIRRYAAHMDRLIGDLLDVASIEAARLSVAFRVGRVGKVIAEAVESFQEAADERGITLELKGAKEPLTAAFDADRICQVMTNLLSNAVKFTSDGGSVSVKVVDDGDEIHVTVDDTGVGVPEGELDSIFDRFWKADANDRRGTGLGLFISRHIVEAHGGRIWAERRVRGGTRIQFTISSDLATTNRDSFAGKPHASH